MRKKPVKHRVRTHKRNGKTVSSYVRGSGSKKSPKIANPKPSSKPTGKVFDYVDYDTGEQLTLEEVVKGQIALDKAIEQDESFEGWVHCQGPKASFMQPGDTKLQKALSKAGSYASVDSQGIIVSEKTVKRKFKEETGKSLRLGKGKSTEYCPACGEPVEDWDTHEC